MMKNKFCKAMVDAHIDYLLFLNTNFNISNMGFLELAPILNEIRYEVYENVKNIDIIDDLDINEVIVEKIKESLRNRRLIKTCNYVDAFIESEDINNIGLALFLRRIADNMNIVTGNKIADEFIDKIHNLIPRSDLTIDTKADSLIEYYLSSLRIIYDEKQDIRVYILEVLSYFNIVCNYLQIDCSLLSENQSINGMLSTLTRLFVRLRSYKKELLLEKSN